MERLSRALETAALAGKWDVVRRLTDALERLQGAERGDAAVVGLDAFRGRKGAAVSPRQGRRLAPGRWPAPGA